MVIILCISFFIAASIVSESVGVLARAIGSLAGQPTVGYSTHVRIATLGRFFTLLAARTLGYIVDQGGSAKDIALTGSIAFFIIAIMLYISIKKGFSFVKKIFELLNRRKIEIEGKYIDNDISLSNLCFSTPKLTVIVFISYSITAIGVILVNYIASLHPEIRATIVQTTAIITSLGTLLHIFIIDSVLSNAADNDPEKLHSLVYSYLSIRFIASLFLSFLFFILYLR